MSHSQPSRKADYTLRSQFLGALYQDIPNGCWLEFRCIHPVTKEVRVIWSQSHQLNPALDAAGCLNDNGYGIYYAPCPRRERRGSAEYAAFAPVLWAESDCDNDARQRADALERLTSFKPAPSIIIDSGGGWHGYWLLDQPLPLEDAASRARIKGTLQGLFRAVGGDPQYIISVATPMRLPLSRNTKPSRNNALVSFVEFHPSRRYTLSQFDWLEVKPTTPPVTQWQALDQGARAPLPPKTLAYLSQGAPPTERNNALFHAACQFRDARYTQSEAENALVPRFVADHPDANPDARTREARRTIASAYSRASRAPIGRRSAGGG